MMEVLHAEIKPSKTRLGLVKIRYYDLTFFCDICVYRGEKLWLRLPQIWTSQESKSQLVFWEDKKKSDEFQLFVLSKIFDMIGLNLEGGIKIRKAFMEETRPKKNTEE